MKSNQLPKPIRIYQNHHLDSTYWDHYRPRDDDIIIATSYKSGTTWMQNIVLNLIFLGQEVPSVSGTSPWLAFRPSSIADRIAGLEAQTHRRVIKSHLPLDGMPFHPPVNYIVVARDPRDVFMSFWNHYSNYTDQFYQRVNGWPDLVGDPLPRSPEDLHQAWSDWIGRGWFPWESEGYPFWGNMHHTKTWWPYRNLDNILFVHFNDLLADLPAEIGRVANFLSIVVSEEAIATISQAVSFSAVKNNLAKHYPGSQETFADGANTFFFKGTNGRWQGVLSDEELALYEAKAAAVLPSDCARWLEQGRMAW